MPCAKFTFAPHDALNVAEITVPAPNARLTVRGLVNVRVIRQTIEIEKVEAVSLHEKGIATNRI
jgi:hypothetical protein